MKRIFSMILALVLVIACLPVFQLEVHAVTVASGTCGDNLTWTLDDAGLLTISGTGDMYDYSQDSVPWAEYREIIQSVTLVNGVTSVGDYAFYDITHTNSFTLSNTLQHIGDYAFSKCDSLIFVDLPTSVLTVGEGAFTSNSLTSVYLNDGLISIGDRAFEATNITAAIVPETVTYIGKCAFADCQKMFLSRIWCKNATIDEEAFSGCTALEEIHFYGNAPVFKTNVFSGVSATVNYPRYNNSWTKAVRQNYGGNLVYKSYDSHEITSGTCGDNVIWSLAENGTLTISGTGPMDDCNKYTAGSGGGYVISRPWGQYSNQVKSAVIEDGVTYIGINAFLQDSNLQSVKIADSVTEIGSFAFKECSSLTSISFGSGLEKTGTDVFLRCTSLKSVELPNNDVDYGNNLFKGCTSLTSVTIPETQTTLGESMFSGCTNLTDITIPNSVTKIKGSAFQSSGLKSVHIPESVTVIDQYAFRYCENLEEVVIPSSVKTLSTGVFNNCLNLKKLTLSEGLETIGGYLIERSWNVTEITIPSTVTALTNTFSQAYGLKVVKFMGNYPKCTGNVFGSCELTAYYPENNSTWTEDVRQNYGGKITWVSMKKPQLSLDGEEFAGQDTVWIEGLPYPIQGEGNDRYVELPTEDDCYMVTYTYHTGDASDIHTQYPTGMKVYKISDGEITHIPQLDNLLQYSGASIRITGKKGIRMITSLTKTNKNALTGKGLAGFKLLEYGTALCFASEIQEGDALVLGRDFTRSNFAYKKGVADPVFASTKDLIQYTNVLVGFSLDQCKDDIAMRPYIIMEDAAGNQITLYGGTIYRSIGYIAYQNRTVFKPKTASYNYVWEIIHHVYGDKYDADYKG